MTFRFPLAALLLALLAGCVQPTPEQPPHQTSDRHFLFAWGMWNDPVFDRDVKTFARAYEASFGAPTDAALFGFTDKSLTPATLDRVYGAITDLAEQARDGVDPVVVMLSSHGGTNVMAVKAPGQWDGPHMHAAALRSLLKPLESDHHVVILQARYSGSLIDDLAHPNRIILTAAAADRTSFGCDPQSDNTWFVRALNRALDGDRTWSQIYSTTTRLVADAERSARVTPSLPQAYVGNSVRHLWTDPAIPGS